MVHTPSVLLLVLGLLFARPAAGIVHPLHTSLTVLDYFPGSGTVDLRIRAFADDFGLAVEAFEPVAARAGVPPVLGYLGHAVRLWDPRGRAVQLEWHGSKRSGDVLWIHLRARLPGGLRGARILNRLSFDLYDDQVNIVQITERGKRRNLLFTPGSKAKAIR